MWTFFVWLMVVYISERGIDSHPDVVIHSQLGGRFQSPYFLADVTTEVVCIL